MKQKGSVLVIDDEESILGMLEQYLLTKEYRIKTAGTGEEARRLLEQENFDVALIDLKLTDCTGLELIQHFSTSHPDMTCIMMTAYASLDSTIEALRLNVYDYILKPFDLVKIGEVVDAAFNHALLRRKSARVIRRLETANRRLEKSKKDLSRRILQANRELAEVNESLKQHVTRLKMLYQMGRDISSNENWSDSLDRFLMALCKYLVADGAALLLFSARGQELKVRTSYHIEDDLLKKAVDLLLASQRRDTLPPEVFHLESCLDEKVKTCLELKKRWLHTIVPLLYKGRWLGFLLLKKEYATRRTYLRDYHFINTIQTILTEEVANAVSISRLRNLKDFNETVLESINSGVITTDREGRVIFINTRAREIIGNVIDDKKRFDDLFQNPFGSGSLFDHLTSCSDRNDSFEGRLVLPGGKTIPVRLSTTIVEMDDYHGKTVVAIFEDLTEQKAMEEELRRSDRLRSLGELSAGVAHEIRNPLTGIATTAQVLKEKLDGEPEKIKYVSVIMDEINRLDGIIRNLLTFARPISPDATDLALGVVIEETLELLAEKAAERQVTVTFKNTVRDDRCILDGDQIKQVILNVALNGIQSCGGGGRLAVYLRDAEDRAYVTMEFVDTGEGIPEEIADKLYNPFFTTRSDGSGLGLSISRRIIENHGGRIFHRSTVGKGTSFIIELPRKMVVAARREEATRVS